MGETGVHMAPAVKDTKQDIGGQSNDPFGGGGNLDRVRSDKRKETREEREERKRAEKKAQKKEQRKQEMEQLMANPESAEASAASGRDGTPREKKDKKEKKERREKPRGQDREGSPSPPRQKPKPRLIPAQSVANLDGEIVVGNENQMGEASPGVE